MKVKVNINKDALNGLVNNFLDKTGEVLVTESKRLCPVKTGKLQESIEIKEKDYGNSLNSDKKVTVGTSVPYSIFVELGTRRMSPKSFLRASLDNLVNLLRR
jgi:HK97 gp10 family phage protein